MTAITREPIHPGYDSDDDEFHLLANGQRIGGTYHCPPGDRIQPGKQWVSYGPAGYSFHHPTREDAERAQLDAAGITPTPATTVDVPADPEPAPLPADAYDKALTEAAERGTSHCSNTALTASICDGPLPVLVGAVSPRLVWEGAQRRGMTAKQLLLLAHRDPMAIEALQW